MLRKLILLFGRKRAEEDLDDELRLHLQLRAQQLRDAGAAEQDAFLQAARRFGNRTAIREQVRDAWSWAWLEQLLRDLRFAIRSLRKNTMFSAVAIASLALALGANTAVFAFARAIVLRKLPVAAADRLVILRQHNEMFHMENCCFAYREFQEFRRRNLGFEDLLAVAEADVDLRDQDQSEKLAAELVSGNYFRMLGIRPIRGRPLDDSDDQPGAPPVCVISYRLWQGRFGGREDAVGRRVAINGSPFEIVGVTAPGFTGAALHEIHDLEAPSSAAKVFIGEERDALGWAEVIGRLRPGVTPSQAAVRLNSVGLEIEKQAGFQVSPKDLFRLADGSQGLDSRKEEFGRPVLLLFALVGVVLLVACANLSALLLVRSVERTPEAGVRMALGGSRSALMRHFLLESLALAAAGGAAGWLVAYALTAALLRILGSQGDGLAPYVAPDPSLFAFSAAAALCSGLLFGCLPAWRAAQSDPLDAIRRRAAAPLRAIASRALLSAQIALSLALLFAAGLFARTLHNLRSIDLGFHPENVALLRLDSTHALESGGNSAVFFQELLRRARELPGTRAASLSTISVLSGAMTSIVVRIPGYQAPTGLSPTTYFTIVSGGYFRTLGFPLLAGRDFTGRDRATGSAEGVAIVNERFARQFFHGDALGRTLVYGGGRSVRVVGIAADSHFRRLREEAQPILYLPVTQWTFPQTLYLQVRVSGAADPAIARLRALARQIDSRVAIDRITTMEMQIDEALAQQRLLSFLSTFTGLLAVTLAAIGLYGVLSFSVARRTREIGIRIAVGAPRGAIFRQFLAESARIVGLGIALGIPLALASGKLAASLLYGLQPADLSTAVIATTLLSLIALAAALLPAIRAARLDPNAALHWE